MNSRTGAELGRTQKKLIVIILISTAFLFWEGSLCAQVNSPRFQPLPPNPSPSLSKDEIRQMVREEMDNSGTLRDRVQSSVDRSVNNSIVWMQILLGGLSLFLAGVALLPVGLGVFVWIFRKSIIGQLNAEAKEEVKNQLETQVREEIEAEVQARVASLEADIAETAQSVKQLFSNYAQEIKRRLHALPSSIELTKPKELGAAVPTASASLPPGQADGVDSDPDGGVQSLIDQIQIMRRFNPSLELSADEDFRLGNALYLEQRYEEAIAAYDTAITLNPNFAEAYYNKGIALDHLQRYKDAIASYDQALALNPNTAETWYNKGLALRRLQRAQEAIAAYEQAITLRPDYIEAWSNKGVALEQLGQHQAAIDAYDKVIELQPDYVETWYNKGVALGQLGDYDAAIAAYDTALKLKPDFAGAWYNKACMYSLKNETDSAMENLQKAIALDPAYRDLAKTDTDFDPIRKQINFI